MGAINFLSENLADQAVVSLDTGTENAQFPLTNLQNDATAVKFRSNENSIVIVFDMQQTREIDTFALHGDLNSTLGMTAASFRTSLTTDFTSSPVYPVTLSAENLIGYSFITQVEHRYAELTLTGTGSFAEVSKVYIGKRIELLQQNLSISSFRYGNIDLSSSSVNDYGQRFVDKRPKQKTLGGNIEFAIKSEQESLDEMFLRQGTSAPLWMIIDQNSEAMNDGAFKLAIYGYFDRTPTWTASGGQTYNTSLTVIQAG